MTDFDGDQSYYEFDNEQWYAWATSPTLLNNAMPPDLFELYNANIIYNTDDGYESPQEIDQYQSKAELLGHALDTDYMVPDRDKLDTYDGVIQDIWT